MAHDVDSTLFGYLATSMTTKPRAQYRVWLAFLSPGSEYPRNFEKEEVRRKGLSTQCVETM